MTNKLIQQKYFNIGKCIYCGGAFDKLTDEHVIPFALGGTMVLHNASCEECRDITSRYERNPLNENWSEIRACLDYPSRKRKFENETFGLHVTLKNKEETVLRLKKSEVLGIAQFLEFALPGFFLKSGVYKKGSIVTGNSVFGFGVDIKQFLQKHNIKQFSFSDEYKSTNFEKMIARIAYCFTIACFGYDCFSERLVLPSILNQKDDIGFWFGCDPMQEITSSIGKQNGKNAIKLGILQKKNSTKRYVVVRLKFFANTDTPEYIVVVGTLRDDFLIPKS